MSEAIKKVLANCPQSFSDPEKAQARNNIGALGGVKVQTPEGTSELVPDAEGKVTVDLTHVQEQVQSDWAETDTSDPSYIQNKPDLDLLATKAELTSGLAGKQDTLIPGDNITIVGNVINATAAPQQQADWNQSDSSAVDYIKNKPQNLVQDANYVHTDNNFTNTDKTKLDGIQPGAEANVQADWTQSDTSADDYIKHKPNLATVATSGSYNDLSDKPTIPAAQVQSDWAQSDSTAVDYIKNKPAQMETKPLVAGTGIEFVSAANSVTINAEVADVTQNGTSVVNAQGVAEIVTRDVPSSTSADNGKVLSVDSSGTPTWTTPSGGQTYTAGGGISISQNNEIAAKVDGTSIVIDPTTGEMSAPGGGGGGGSTLPSYYDRIEQKTLDGSMASIVLGPMLTREMQTGTFNQRALAYSALNGAYLYGRGNAGIRLMDFVDSGYVRLSRSGTRADNPTYAIWFPCTANSDNYLTPIDTSVYLKTKSTYNWSATNYGHYVYTSTGSELAWFDPRDARFPAPFSATGEIDTTLFDQVGDWSNITMPQPWQWVLAFQDSNGNFARCGGDASENYTELSVAYPRSYYNVKLKPSGGLSENRGAGLYVTNPLPSSSSSDENKVLTVNSSGSPEWVTPSGGGSLPAYSSADSGKSLVVNGNGDGVEWDRKISGVVYNGTSSSELRHIRLNTYNNPSTPGLVAAFPVGAQGVSCGFLMPDPGFVADETVDKVARIVENPNNSGVCMLEYQDDAAVISPLEKVSISTSTNPYQIDAEPGKWYEIVCSQSTAQSWHIYLEANSTVTKNTVHTIVRITRTDASVSCSPSLVWHDERGIVHYEQCDLTGSTSYYDFDCLVRKNGYTVEGTPWSFARVRRI